MPAHNAERTVESAVISILRQNVASLELIVVDDGSTDATPEKLEKLARADRRIKVIHQSQRGITPALNAGLPQCVGEYVARMDADDISLPWRLRLQVEFMDARPDVAASGTAMIPFGTRLPMIGLPVQMPVDDVSVRTRLLFNPPIMHPTAIFRRSVVDRDEFYAETMPQAQDYELWSRLGREHRLSNISRICLLYRRSSGSISSSKREAQQARARCIRLTNLTEFCGEEFVRRNGDSHAEIMARTFAPTALVAALPGYIDALLERPGIAHSVVADIWFGYCLAYTRFGGDGSRLYGQSRLGSSTARHFALRSLARFRRTRR